MTVEFHCIMPWRLRHEKDEIVIVIIIICIF